MNQFISRAAALFVYRDPVEGRCAACGLPERQHLPFLARVHHITQRGIAPAPSFHPDFICIQQSFR